MPKSVPPELAGIVPAALFLDFDGTVVEFADHPEDIAPPISLVPLLEKWSEQLDGALAIVSGRDIDSIDRFLSPLNLPIAGAHGMVRRGADGGVTSAFVDENELSMIAEKLENFAAGHAGSLVERKRHSVALHYRKVPYLADAADQSMLAALPKDSAFEILRGKMVVEARSKEAGKGRAIAAFLREPPFEHRRPVFAGDDVTDEDGFDAVNRMKGVSIKVGEGITRAEYRLSSPADLLRWLSEGISMQEAMVDLR
ncbi:MAG: trehalose-phosphatase [Pseudomonadota bacterium]